MVSRRGVLKLLGGGVVLATGSAAGAVYVAGQPSKAARAPWRDAGQYEDVRKRALSYALLAPNPHNLQPWLVSLDGDDGLTLYHDSKRRLPVTDPYDRQITIGCGAFLELLSLAAAQEGY
ncbi:MAG: twin-arginine translocation pathway signal protein, partial [Pseudomonadota bacterium]